VTISRSPEHLPWYGPAYHDARQRLLLLGKAHYGVQPSEDSPEFTLELVRKVRDGHVREPFFTKTAALVAAASEPPFQFTSEFWNRIAFFNYVPVTVGSCVHDAPTPAMWRRGKSRLVELLEALKPTHVLSLGIEQWNHIRTLGSLKSEPVRHTKAGPIHVWRSDAMTMLATPIAHPTASFGFSPGDWEEHVRTFLSEELAMEVGVF
jgi:hypothetical protein